MEQFEQELGQELWQAVLSTGIPGRYIKPEGDSVFPPVTEILPWPLNLKVSVVCGALF